MCSIISQITKVYSNEIKQDDISDVDIIIKQWVVTPTYRLVKKQAMFIKRSGHTQYAKTV